MAALSQQQMMAPLADRLRAKEAKKNGLVILSAVYGRANAVGVPEKVKACEGAMDVTVVLQFMVKDSILKLYAGSKQGLMGFWAMEEEEEEKKEKKEGENELVLYVRYSYGGKVWEVTVNDLEPLYLPAFRAMELGDVNQVE